MASTTSSIGSLRAVSLLTRLWILLLMLCYPLSADKIECSNVDVRVNIDNFQQLNGCKVINGHLQIVLFDMTKVKDFENLSFPGLTEIMGFLLIFRVQGLTSLGKLFPNLRRIHGKELIGNSALVIVNAGDLVEIGLKSLIRLERGEVTITQCPKLCYVNTVDWKSITKNLTYRNGRTDCPECPAHCADGYCWNDTECQICRGNKESPECSSLCPHYTDGKKCVIKCPAPKITLGFQCITRDECPKHMKIKGDECTDKCPKFFREKGDRKCEPCYDDCEKVCQETVVDNAGHLQQLEGCTVINGSLTLGGNAKDYNISDRLPYYMDQIRVITGSLKVHRTRSLENLYFLSNLKSIGNNTAGMLSAYENENLNDLFLENVTRSLKLAGNVSFHYNSQLCLTKIEHFLNATNKLDLLNETTMVSTLSNGDKAACNVVDMGINITNITSTTVSLSWNNISLSPPEIHVGYFVYYSHDNLKRDGDPCRAVWSAALAQNSSLTLSHLLPFTKYTYYITRLTSKISARKQTNFFNFTTLTDDPSPPTDLIVNPLNSSSIHLQWGKPPELNGVLWRYQLYVVEEPDNIPSIKSRNYCNVEHGAKRKSVLHQYIQETTLNCDCNGKIIGSFCYSKKVNGIELKNSCDKYTYKMLNEANSTIHKRSNDLPPQTTIGFNRTFIIIDATNTSYIVPNLKHYTLYVFYLAACNHPPENTSQYSPEPNKTYCSAILMESARTKKNETADVIPDLNYTKRGQNQYLEWTDPPSPNQVIVSYTILYNRTDQHIEHKPICLSDENITTHRIGDVIVKRFRLPKLGYGSYSFHVQTTSLAGKSRLGRSVTFEIPNPATTTTTVIWVSILCIIVLIILLAIGLYFYRKYLIKHNKKNLLLFRSVNPDYMGVQYEADDWEMDRSNIEILKELGKGNFGKVYSGFIKSQNIPCAVKTINDTQNVQNKNDFLKEASIMKPLNGAHHVVKLLGVVSKGDPPYVVLELMARGDLKNYLRRSRESSHNITCVEMYKMAAEIADGMMYLTSKKFVHRDLATRNCMVSADHTVKVGDFGMARDIYENDYYRKETKGLLPVRWMAPESLADGLFTSDSDVWSYGVVLWEMANLAEQPYQGLGNDEVCQFIIGRGVLQRPEQCPDLLYEIMAACWKWKPNDRPTFEQIVEKLESHVGQDFKLVSFYHSRAGEEYRLNSGERVVNKPALSKIPDAGNDDYVHWDDDEHASLYTSSTRPKNSVSFTSHRSKTSSFF